MSVRDSALKRATGLGIAFGMLLAALGPQTLSAQDVDGRWLPWLGCWEASDAGAEAPLLCIQPLEGEASGVELVTWADGNSCLTACASR